MKWMKLLLLVAVSAWMLPIVGCGDDDKKPTGPSKDDLIGTWEFESLNMIDMLAEGLASYLRNQGGQSEDEISNEVEELRSGLGRPGTYSITFKADNTWSDNGGGVGTWGVSGNKLTISGVEGGDRETVFEATYSISGNKLTLTQTGTEFLAGYGAGPWADETVAADDNFEWVYVKVD